MVFYFMSNVVSPAFTIFMGLDKYESVCHFNYDLNRKFIDWLFFFFEKSNTDEDLIKWGWPEDVWFHVDNLSSAHVYLRLQPVCKDA